MSINLSGATGTNTFTKSEVVGGTKPFTIDFWLKLHSVPTTTTTILEHRQGSNYDKVISVTSTGMLSFYYYSTASVTVLGINKIPVGEWSHIAVTFDGENIKVWLNGNLEIISATSRTFEYLANVPINIGNFNASLDELRYWSKNLSESEIKDTFNKKIISKNNLINHFEFKELSGLTSKDSLSSVSIKLSNGVTWEKGIEFFRKRLTIKNSTTNQYYSLADKTLIPLTSLTNENMILHSIEQGKEIQLDEPFDKIKLIKDTSTVLGEAKTFTHTLSLNDIKIKKIQL